jgi:hypothetical protein
MKKITITLIAALLVSTAFSQRIGIQAAGILASQSVSASGISLHSGSRFSWKAGLVGDMRIGGSFRFMPQLNVVSKGSKFNIDFGAGEASSKSNLTYVEVPLLVTYNTPVGLFFGAGPSIAFGIGGKESVTDNNETTTATVNFDGRTDVNDGKSHYKRMDIGAEILAGYNLPKGLFVNVHYSFGLSSVAPGDASDGKVKNRYFGFGVGKFFGK